MAASDGVPMPSLVIAESLFELHPEVTVWHSQVSPAGSKEDELQHWGIAAQAGEEFVHEKGVVPLHRCTE